MESIKKLMVQGDEIYRLIISLQYKLETLNLVNIKRSDFWHTQQF